MKFILFFRLLKSCKEVEQNLGKEGVEYFVWDSWLSYPQPIMLFNSAFVRKNCLLFERVAPSGINYLSPIMECPLRLKNIILGRPKELVRADELQFHLKYIRNEIKKEDDSISL